MPRKTASKKKPVPEAKPPAATIAAAAVELGVDERTLKTWLGKGCPRGEGGGYDVEAIRVWRAANLKVQRTEPTKVGGRAHWEKRKARADAKMRELELKQKQGLLIEVDVAARVIGQHVAEVKTHLGQLPDFVLSLVKVPAGQAKKVRERLKSKLNDLCEVLQRSMNELATGGTDEEDADE